MNSIGGYILLVIALAGLGAVSAILPRRAPKARRAEAGTDAHVAYDLGFSAGYCGTSLAFNPYRRGWLRLGVDLGDQTSLLAERWDTGNADGRRCATNDLIDKRAADLRSDDRA